MILANTVTLLLLSVFMILIVNFIYQERVDTEYAERGESVARMAAYLINGEMIDQYLETREKDEEYEAVLRHMDMLRIANDVKYLYVQRIVSGGAVFVWDTDPENPVDLGEFDPWDESYDPVLDPLSRGEHVSSVDLDTKWGHLLVAFEPVLRADGSVAGYVGVNISIDVIMREKALAFIFWMIAIALIVIISFAVNLNVTQKNLISPVNMLIKDVESYLTGDMGAPHENMEAAPLLYKGEFAVLSHSITEMETRVNWLLTDLESAMEHEQMMAKRMEMILKSILNGMEALICVCDSETFEILFLNDAIKANFGIEGDCTGQLCHKTLQGLDEPCPTCPYRQLHENPDIAIVWEHHETRKGSVLRKTAKLIGWPDGRTAHLEYAIDITGLREAQKALEQRNHLLDTINRISAVLLQSGSGDFKSNLLKAMGIIAESVGADRAYIWENYINDGELYCYQIYEWSGGTEPQNGKELIKGVSYRDVLPSWEEAFLGKRCVNSIVGDLPESERGHLEKQGIKSIIVVPIYLQKQFWGFAGFDDCHSERLFSENDEAILRSASELIANALIRNNMEKDIKHLETEVDKIYYDPLTGIYNRRYLDENIKRIYKTLSRSGGMLSVMIVDIDNFKKYNDTYGHGAGDVCLITVANTLKDSITRTGDFVARYGGEEFAVILPNTGEDGAKLIADKMLINIRNCGISHEKNGAASCVTVSIGVVTGTVEYPYKSDDYLQRADEMLYQSKRGGKNRYTSSLL